MGYDLPHRLGMDIYHPDGMCYRLLTLYGFLSLLEFIIPQKRDFFLRFSRLFL